MNSVVGTEFVAKAPADGYTFLMMSSTYLTTPLLSRNMPYDPLRDFTGVTLTGVAAAVDGGAPVAAGEDR